uniref:Hydrolase of the metallo-beta-lactamase superfamily n=2 Tax=environmental samples TaxID=68359 RepID=A0A0H4T4T8_9EURY|nr:hydrolase of the metallo-beta-lactamase superfamily [uncultured euryarchaeote Rifle_16ft_4_minimus_37664]
MVSLTFHGGVGEIGGNKILLEDGDARLWLDMGSPFDLGAAYFAEFLGPRDRFGLRDYFALDLIPRIPGLYSHEALDPTDFPWRAAEFTGILITHVHFDHTNHLGWVDGTIPVHLGEGTRTILDSWETTTLSANLGDHPYRTFHTGDTFDLDGVEVEPVHVDHSAPAAYGYLLHTSRGTVAYTGDLRRHGPAGHLTDEFVEAAKAARPIALITEGTRVAPSDPRENLTEADVKARAIDVIRAAKERLALATFPGRDVDRMRTFFEAAKATGRRFVVNAKTAHLLLTMKKDTRIAVPDVEREDDLLVYDRRLDKPPRWESALRDRLKDRVVTADDVRRRPKDFLVQLDFWHLAELVDLRPPEGSPFIHSKSEPFDEDDISLEILENWLRRFGLVRHQIHASGHLSEAEVEAMIREVDPKAVYPVHTEHPERFTRFSRHVVQPTRGEPMPLG